MDILFYSSHFEFNTQYIWQILPEVTTSAASSVIQQSGSWKYHNPEFVFSSQIQLFFVSQMLDNGEVLHDKIHSEKLEP